MGLLVNVDPILLSAHCVGCFVVGSKKVCRRVHAAVMPFWPPPPGPSPLLPSEGPFNAVLGISRGFMQWLPAACGAASAAEVALTFSRPKLGQILAKYV